MGVIAAVRRALERTAGRLDELDRRLRGAGVGAAASGATGGALSAGPALWRDLASQEDLAYVRISGERNAAGWWPARRQWFTPSGDCEDDPEFAETRVYAVGGAVPFRGAAGFIRFSGLRGSADEPMWLTLSGEWHGFLASLVGPPDAQWTYGWTMVTDAPFRAALSHTSPGLGRAQDRASESYEAGVPFERTAYPTSTYVILHASGLGSGLMWFLGYSEPRSLSNCVSV